jgi:hypothetical protein
MKGRFGWNFAYSGGIMRSRTEDTEGTEDFFGGLKWFYAALTSKALGRIAWMGIEDEGDLLPVPEGRSDRSLARSAWDSTTSKEPSRRVRCDSRRYARRFDDWSELGLRSTHTVPYGTVLSGWGCSRHFVPGYDRTVPPGQDHAPSLRDWGPFLRGVIRPLG